MFRNHKVNFRDRMRKAKLKNFSDLSYESQIPLRDLESLIDGKLNDKDLDTLDNLKDFFRCKLSGLFIDGAIWDFTGNAYDPVNGVVYFIQNIETGLIKIGYSKDLDARVRGLATEHKAEMRVIHYMGSYDAAGLEEVMHTLFSDKRVEGEWFSLNWEDIRRVKGEQKNSLVDDSN